MSELDTKPDLGPGKSLTWGRSSSKRGTNNVAQSFVNKAQFLLIDIINRNKSFKKFIWETKKNDFKILFKYGWVSIIPNNNKKKSADPKMQIFTGKGI